MFMIKASSMAKTYKVRTLLVGAVFGLFLNGCANHGPATPLQEKLSSRAAPSDIRTSFSINELYGPTGDHADENNLTRRTGSNSAFGEVKGSLLKIKKSVLGKAFLFTSVLFPADNTPIPHQMLPKVVSFESNGSEIALYELNIYAIYQEIPSTKLLQTFAILAQDDETITFKWAYGVKAISMKTTLGISEIPESMEQMISPADSMMATLSSFLKRIEFVGNQLELEQISQISSVTQPTADQVARGQVSEPLATTIHLMMTLTPYQVNSRFTPLLSAVKKGIGFFEIAQTRKHEGDIDMYATHWDLSPEAGPLTYQIAKNTPAELVSAVEEGVLYWNQVMGREIVRVEKNVEVGKHPSFRKIPIYWIPWNKATFSVASVQPDPLTGEILSATVFLSSPIDLNGRILLRSSLEAANTESTASHIAPSGFFSSALCHLASSPYLASLHELTHTQLANPQIMLKAARDSVRSTTAHEVGHTLGARHNFAGSNASELLSAEEHQKYWKEYILDPEHHGATISSTVMDYFEENDNLLLGAAIREKALLYDQALMKWAYSIEPVELKNMTIPPYCSDYEARQGTVLGCAAYDSGRNPIEGYNLQIGRLRKTLSHILLNAVLTRVKSVGLADRQTVKESVLSLHPNSVSKFLTQTATQIFKSVTLWSSSLALDRKFEGYNWMNQKVYLQETRDFLSKSLDQVHGVPGVLRTAFGLDSSMKVETGWLEKQFADLLSSHQFGKGVTWSGIHYDLTDEEIADLKTYLPQLAEKVEEAYLRDLLLSFTGVEPFGYRGARDVQVRWEMLRALEPKDPTYIEEVVNDQWQEDLSRLAEYIILEPFESTETKGETKANSQDLKTGPAGGLLAGTADGDAITVPLAKFRVDTRLAAARLLNRKIFNRDSWAVEVRNRVLEGVKARALLVARELSQSEQMETANQGLFGLSTKGMNLTRDLKDWTANELLIYTYLRAIDSDESEKLQLHQ